MKRFGGIIGFFIGFGDDDGVGSLEVGEPVS